MGRCMKILAIFALVATIAGAGAVLYGINTLRPQVVQTAASETRGAGCGGHVRRARQPA
ncbi:MAG: hypothetical protein ACLVB5_15580 [Christensenellales bacterium]